MLRTFTFVCNVVKASVPDCVLFCLFLFVFVVVLFFFLKGPESARHGGARL